MLQKHVNTLVAVVIFLLLPSHFAKATEVESIAPITIGEHLRFKSSILDEAYEMNIHLPDSYQHTSEDYQYPVIFINSSHGNQFFHTLTGIVTHLGKMDRMPEAIVVSLNYSGHFAKVQTNGMWGRDEISAYGQPQKYIKHLKQELFPYLAKTYRANDHRLLIGISGSSLFPLYTMTHAPGLFDAYMLVASADMLGMGFDKEQTMTDLIAQTMKANPELKGLLYAVNSDDDIYNPRRDYRPNFAALVDKTQAARHKGFKVKTEVIPNERHYDVFIKATLNWFEQLYPEAQWAPKYRELIAKEGDAMANIDAFYQNLSNQYGFTILPKANRWNSVNCLRFIAGKLLRDGRIEESLTVARRWTQYNPNSAAAFDQLAQSLEAGKQTQQAIVASTKAVKLAQASDHWRLKDYQQRLSELKKAKL